MCNNKQMEVKDLSWNEMLSKRFNHPLLPKGIMGLFVGKSGCGKTILLMNLLLRPGWLDYKILVKVCFNQNIVSSRKPLKKNYQKIISLDCLITKIR